MMHHATFLPKMVSVSRKMLKFAGELKQKRVMVVISGRDFRANQTKYIKIAHHGEDVVISSRAGNVKLTPISPDDMVVNRNEITPELAAEIEKARREFREGKTISLRTHEDIDRYFDSM